VGSPLFLITGFGSFESVSENPSGALARELDGDPGVVGVEIPVSFRGSAAALDAALERLAPLRPDFLLALGVHPGDGFRLERRAGAALAPGRTDNDGETGEVVSGVMGGGAGDLATDLDLPVLAAELGGLGLGDVTVSEDAGGYVCERIYRHALVRGNELGCPALFLHVPPLKSVSLGRQEILARALLQSLRTRLPGTVG
jgi:pyrrolidone-carboxylate peptidase